jgi:MtN3 and saliva related transmembrane protein
MNLTSAFGFVAGLLTTIAFLPQVLKTWETKTVKDLSLLTFMAQGTACTLWVVYGAALAQIPLILWNALTVLLVLFIIAFIFKYGEKKTKNSYWTILPFAIAVFCAVGVIFPKEIIGYTASAIGVVTLIPQAAKTLKTRETKDISLGMYIIFWIGVALWLTYGILLKNPPVIIVNVAVLSLASLILTLKIKNG